MTDHWEAIAKLVAAIIYLLIEHYLGKTPNGSTLGFLLNNSKKMLRKKPKKEIEK